MKPSLQFSVPCLNIPGDGSRPPTFEGIFYELPSPEFPFRLDFFLANGWCAGLGRFVQEVRVLRPDGQSMAQTGQQAFELTSETQPYMIVNQFQGFQFQAPGVYRIQVLLDGEVRLDYPLEIRQIDMPGSGERPEAREAAPAPQAPAAPESPLLGGVDGDWALGEGNLR